MQHFIYTLDNAIDSFFSEAGASSSREQCDKVARLRCGGDIQPVSIQGSTSYTVIAGPSGNKVIQFREQADLLDMRIFFAHSWQKGTPEDSILLDKSAIRTECYAKFEYLAGALPERFLPAVVEVQTALPALLDECYPVVLTHSDLNGMNILVDPSSGKITGVVYWPGASILPFGFTLYALENALGNMGSDG